MVKNNIKDWIDSLRIYKHPRVIGMMFLGFSAGLPFLLVFSTLSGWLRDVGIERTTIGFISWIGITYSIKVFWAPVVDRVALPFLTNVLGKRRSWMLVAQLVIGSGLFGMALIDPASDIELLAFCALVVAFGSATQDITIDAYRIEAVDLNYQGAMAASYVFGYRIALLVAGAGAFYIAELQSWSFAYICMAAFMLVGITTTLIIREPQHIISEGTQLLESYLENSIGIKNKSNFLQRFSAWFIDAVVSPFIEFFQRTGWMALVILLLIGAYKLSDITMGVMANPFYLDQGFSKIEIANITKIFGFFMTIFGAALGGVFVIRFGVLRPLLIGAILIFLTNLLFVLLAISEASIIKLALVISADNLSGGFASSAFIAYLSGLTNKAYTATQYALFSSLMTLPAKIVGGFSGYVVDMAGYPIFFLYAGMLGLPAIALVLFLLKYSTSSGADDKNLSSAKV